jgi:alternate signal-mediated exported protein
MNKLLKGAIAASAGVALLLGGAGTFALWNTSATVNGSSVSSGTLTIATSGAAAWKNVSVTSAGTANSTIADIATYRIVPGDTLEMTQTVTVNATGTNLTASLTYDDASIGATGTASAALKAALVKNLTATATGGGTVTRVGTTNVYTVAPSANTSTVTLKFTVELPSSTTGTVGQTGTIDLSALGFTLTQNAR